MQIIKLIVVILICFSLYGCKEPLTYDFLLQHPERLEKEIINCEKGLNPAASCDIIKQAGEKFMLLANMRSENAEAFGKQILQAEYDLVVSKETLQHIQQEYEKMKIDNSPNQVDMQKKLVEAESAYQSQLQKVKILLAVVVATTGGDL